MAGQEDEVLDKVLAFKSWRTNVSRVIALLLAAGNASEGAGNDIFRAAIVFLHAAVEDFLRDFAREQFANCAPIAYTDIPLARVPGSEKEFAKFTLVELARFRGKSVEDVLAASVDEFLDTTSFSQRKHIPAWLARFGVKPQPYERFFNSLESLANRRHKIVHTADKLSAGWTPDDWNQTLHWIGDVVEFVPTLISHVWSSCDPPAKAIEEFRETIAALIHVPDPE